MNVFGQAPQTPESRIAALKADIEKATALKSKTEGQIEEKQKQREKILADLTALGVTPENLDAEIEKVRTERDTHLTEGEKLIPKDLLTGQVA